MESEHLNGGELFHYTSAAGMEGIISGNEIHASNINFLNDYSEGQLLVDGMFQRIYSETLGQFKEIWPNIANRSEIECLGSPEEFVRNHVNTLRQAVESSSQDHFPTFVAPFCVHKKDTEMRNGLLSQWRGYGADGGMCLVFERAKIEKASGQENLSGKGICLFKSATYIAKRDDIEALVDKLNLDIIASSLNQYFLQPANNPISYFKEIESTIRPLTEIAPFLKDETFVEEQEHRLAFAAFSQSMFSYLADNDAVGNTEKKKTRFKMSKGRLTPYVSLLEGSMRNSLLEVIVGPGKNQYQNYIAAKMLLKELGVENAFVRHSKIPFEG